MKVVRLDADNQPISQALALKMIILMGRERGLENSIFNDMLVETGPDQGFAISNLYVAATVNDIKQSVTDVNDRIQIRSFPATFAGRTLEIKLHEPGMIRWISKEGVVLGELYNLACPNI